MAEAKSMGMTPAWCMRNSAVSRRDTEEFGLVRRRVETDEDRFSGVSPPLARAHGGAGMVLGARRSPERVADDGAARAGDFDESFGDQGLDALADGGAGDAELGG